MKAEKRFSLKSMIEQKLVGNYRLSSETKADFERICLGGLREYSLEQADQYYDALFK